MIVAYHGEASRMIHGFWSLHKIGPLHSYQPNLSRWEQLWDPNWAAGGSVKPAREWISGSLMACYRPVHPIYPRRCGFLWSTVIVVYESDGFYGEFLLHCRHAVAGDIEPQLGLHMHWLRNELHSAWWLLFALLGRLGKLEGQRHGGLKRVCSYFLLMWPTSGGGRVSANQSADRIRVSPSLYLRRETARHHDRQRCRFFADPIDIYSGFGVGVHSFVTIN